MAIKIGPLWTPQQIASATQGKWISGPSEGWAAGGVNYYLNQILPGDLGITTTPGIWSKTHPDTSNHIYKFFEKGAVAVIADKPPTNLPKCYPVFLVKNTRQALDDLARARRNEFEGKVICVTGSVGKTSVVRYLHHLIGQQAFTYASDRNFNHAPGVPLSMAQTPQSFQYGVYENAMERTGELTLQKTQIIRPHVSIITNIAPAHLVYYPERNPLDKIAESKAKIFEASETNGTAVLNCDCDYYEQLKIIALKSSAPNIISFGENTGSDIRLLSCNLHSNFSEVKASICGEPVNYFVGLPGKHVVINTLVVLAAVRAVGADWRAAAAACCNLPILERHLQRYSVALDDSRFTLIDDTFNSSPMSMRAALKYTELLQPIGGGRRIAVLGEMAELGQRGAQIHAELANDVICAKFDKVFTIGDLTINIFYNLPSQMRALHADSADILKDALYEEIQPNDIVLFKCSHSSAINKANVVRFLRSCWGHRKSSPL
ncbi:MAG: Mur ligase family protein [Gammaproteobacteria bacterium]|nr:Mur ligase family protein [Gammaproteobacteria bacterium]